MGNDVSEMPTIPAPSGSASPDEPAPEDRIGRFVVSDVLGRGGMGVVVSARDPHLDRSVAIKLVRTTGSGVASEVKARLLREAQAMARLRHENIVSVYEVGEHAGQVYVAMEQVSGGTLADELARMGSEGPADWKRIVELFAKAGRGLAAAHAAGMVHRDFKPDNVFIDDDDRVLVGDFGIVSTSGVSAPATSGHMSLFAEQLTRADEVIGTPVYMSPEQHSGERVDTRSDQFSFCVALYEALSGQLPFAGNTRESYVDSIYNGNIRPIPAERRIPEWLGAALSRGLSADPADRFASMQDLLVELGADPENAGRLGRVQRLMFLVTFIVSLAVWGTGVVVLELRFSYTMHYFTNLWFFGVVVAVGWFGRHAVARSRFNQRALIFGVTLGIALLTISAGGDLLGLRPDVIAALFMLICGAMSLLAVTLFGWRIIPMGVCYLIGFLLASARLDLVAYVLATTHMITAVTAYVIFVRHSNLKVTSTV